MNNHDWVRVLKIIIPYFLVVGLFQVFAYLLLGISLHDSAASSETIFQMTVVSLAETLGTFLVIWLFCKYVDKRSMLALGLNKTGGMNIYSGLLLGFMVMLFAFIVLILSQQITLEKFQFSFWNFSLSIIMFLSVSFSEELIIRGYVLNNLLSSFHKYLALTISSVIFAAMHLANQNMNLLGFVNLFLAGVLLGIVYLYTRNLWFSIALHFTWNFSQGTIFGFNVSGKDVPSLIVQGRLENNIWNGGSFGFEGSILCVLFQIVCILLLYYFFHKKKPEVQVSRIA